MDTQTNTEQGENATRNGIIIALSCYIFWGISPIYWKLLDEVNSAEIIAHRMIWSFVLMVIICAVMKVDFAHLLKDRRALAYLVPATILVSINWSMYIFGVSIDLIVECSLGYYINPLISILLGVIIFKERMSAPQIVAVALCALGVLYLTLNYGRFPWIALGLALTFGLYGAIKKKAGYPPIQAQAVESSLQVIPALIFAIALANATGSHGFMGDTATSHGWIITLLLIGAGPVTAVPLIMFSKAVNTVPLSMMGFLQYVNPTAVLLVGVLFNGEPFTFAHAICFGCIWTGLALIAVEGAVLAGKQRRAAAGQRHDIEK